LTQNRKVFKGLNKVNVSIALKRIISLKITQKVPLIGDPLTRDTFHRLKEKGSSEVGTTSGPKLHQMTNQNESFYRFMSH
jgi:hypothetical protein